MSQPAHRPAVSDREYEWTVTLPAGATRQQLKHLDQRLADLARQFGPVNGESVDVAGVYDTDVIFKPHSSPHVNVLQRTAERAMSRARLVGLISDLARELLHLDADDLSPLVRRAADELPVLDQEGAVELAAVLEAARRHAAHREGVNVWWTAPDPLGNRGRLQPQELVDEYGLPEAFRESAFVERIPAVGWEAVHTLNDPEPEALPTVRRCPCHPSPERKGHDS